jgi:hypothetical protein
MDSYADDHMIMMVGATTTTAAAAIKKKLWKTKNFWYPHRIYDFWQSCIVLLMFKKPTSCPHTLKSHNLIICGRWCYIYCLDRPLTTKNHGILRPMVQASSFFVGYFIPRSYIVRCWYDWWIGYDLERKGTWNIRDTITAFTWTNCRKTRKPLQYHVDIFW